ncbi:MAG: hypothetical protein AB7M93_30680 [Candidatus Obscuribacterales bacterium]
MARLCLYVACSIVCTIASISISQWIFSPYFSSGLKSEKIDANIQYHQKGKPTKQQVLEGQRCLKLWRSPGRNINHSQLACSIVSGRVLEGKTKSNIQSLLGDFSKPDLDLWEYDYYPDEGESESKLKIRFHENVVSSSFLDVNW